MPEKDATDQASPLRVTKLRNIVRKIASLKESKLDYDRRIAKADYIPDLSLSFDTRVSVT